MMGLYIWDENKNTKSSDIFWSFILFRLERFIYNSKTVLYVLKVINAILIVSTHLTLKEKEGWRPQITRLVSEM